MLRLLPLALVAATAAGAATAPADPAKLICKRQEVVGSLIARKRVCMTAAQWRTQAAFAREETERMQQPGALSQ